MAWCPKCKNEYREGIAVCADCGVELVDSLSESVDLVPIYFGTEEQLCELKSFLQRGGVEDAVIQLDEKEKIYELFVSQASKKQAEIALQLYLATQANEAEEVEETKEPAVEIKEPYQSSAEKAADNRSSAWMLMVMGVIGIVFVGLSSFKLIPFRIGSSPMLPIVLAAIFVLLFFAGILSLKNANKYDKKAIDEASQTKEILDWCKEHLKADEIDSEIYMQDAPEEVKYFKRLEKMRTLVNGQFPEIDQAFLESLLDEQIYESVFQK